MSVRDRRGVTLVELLVGMVVLAIVGLAATRLIVGQSRFMEAQEAGRVARAVSRSSFNRLMTDLRMVEALGGLEAAAPGGRDFTVRVPYAFGVVCAASAGAATLSLLPVDSAMFAEPGYSGFAWRDADGVYTYVPSGSLAAGNISTCNAAGITTLPAAGGSPAGKVVVVGGSLSPVPPVGSIAFLYRRVRYEFRESAAVPGRIGLWRTLVATGATEELAAPFDTTAHVRFFVGSSPTAQAAVPSPLSSVRGLELHLNGRSEHTPRDNATYPTSNVTTAVFFENRVD